MADLGFLPGVKRLLDRTPRDAQRLLFSATLDNGIDVIVKRYLHDPVTHSVDPAVAPVATMTHHVLAVEKDDKPAVVRELASGQGRTLLFMRTKHTAKKLARQLTANGIPAVDLHGNLSQNARERNLEAFSSGAVRVLVATDIAARGIHVDDVGLVVHVDPPAEHKAYLHRSGRTARAGADGVVVTVMTPDQAGDVRTLTRQAGITPTRTAVVPGSPALLELTGPHAPLVAPVPDALVGSASGSGAVSGLASGRGVRSAGGSGRSRSGQGRSGQARSGQPTSGLTRSAQAASGPSRSGHATSGPSRSGQAASGQPAAGSGARRRRRPRRPAA
jgi:superfamily II DNA/RNA helicase